MSFNLFRKMSCFFKDKKELKKRVDERTLMITEGLGGKDNINDVMYASVKFKINGIII